MSNVARRKAEVFVGDGGAGSAADSTKAPKKTALKKAAKRFMQSMVLLLKPLGEIGGNPCLRMESFRPRHPKETKVLANLCGALSLAPLTRH